MKCIKLTNSNILVQVNDEDYSFLNQWNWQIDNKSKAIYRCQTLNYQSTIILMSRVIAERMGLDLTNQIDHVDRNPTNNQRENLRAATKNQNQWNRGPQKDNKIGYKGVSFHKQTKKFRAYISVNGKRIHLGHYFYAKNAAKAYDIAALKYHGEFAYTNFPKEDYE